MSKPAKPQFEEEVLLHGDSINFSAAKVSDKPGRIRISGAHIADYKTVDTPGDRLEVRYVKSHQIALVAKR